VVVGAAAAFALGYIFYGRFLSRRICPDDTCLTPACEINDGVDYVPAKPALLLGQHFSAIAAAGPIVGPIMACLWFGWLPALLWIVIGSIFVGGPHDYCSLVASLRNRAASIGEIVRRHMPERARVYFLIFVWLALIYVIIAFTDITAHTFKTTMQGMDLGSAVAGSSILYLAEALLMGFLLYRAKMKLWLATIIFIPLTLVIVYIGPHLPIQVLNALKSLSLKQWDLVLLGYCMIASWIPVWLLLQPRGYLGGWFLYLVILVGLGGALFGGFRIEYPAVTLEGLRSSVNGKAVFPVLFITIACGACSGFHGIVASGTTSKQIGKFRDSVIVGYGAMLLEGLVAVLAMATVMMLPRTAEILKTDPNMVYANGIAKYLGLVKIAYGVALPFALLAFSTFVYDTLDVCTRLARYILQELLGWKSRQSSVPAALLSLTLPLAFLMLTKERGYLVAWPIFGTSNQLLASLILLAISMWLVASGRNPLYAVIPMAFMTVVTVWSLIDFAVPLVKSVPQLPSGTVPIDTIISGLVGIVLLVLSFALIWEAVRALVGARLASRRSRVADR